jgi:hypothetical protein
MVEKLTDANIIAMEVYKNRYISIGRNTDRIDRDQLKTDIELLYKTFKISNTTPEIVVKDSPLACWEYICEKIGEKISYTNPFLCGCFDASIFSFYDYSMDELNVNIEEQLLNKYHVWKKILNYGYIFPFDDVCIVSEKPTVIRTNSEGIVHADGAKAIEFADGFGVYILNGVRMNEEYVMTPWDKLDPKTVQTESNAEVRRELVRKIGIERVCDALHADVLDTDGDYELLALDIGDNVKRPYLKMKNPSIGVYHIEGVAPSCKTVEDALFFRNGTKEKPEFLS